MIYQRIFRKRFQQLGGVDKILRLNVGRIDVIFGRLDKKRFEECKITMNLVVVVNRRYGLWFGMRLFFFVRFVGLGMFLLMPSCREATNTNAPTTLSPSGFVLSDKARVMISGDSLTQTFTSQNRDDGNWNETGVVVVQRLDKKQSPAAWNYSGAGALHEQVFQEDAVSYTMTTGILRSKGLLFHRIRCDHPGLLEVRATLHPFTAVEPRQIISRVSPASQMWLIPYESEVSAEGDALVIRGEGELLLIWHWPQDGHFTTWQSLLREYDPAGGEHPDIAKIADLLQQEATQQEE